MRNKSKLPVLLGALGFFVAFALHLSVVSGYDCSSLYFKETEGVLNYLANVSIIIPTTTNGWKMYFIFDRDFTGVAVWVGSTEQNGPEGSFIMTNSSSNGLQTSGSRFYFRFRVNWMEQTPPKDPPTLISLRFQDIELCR